MWTQIFAEMCIRDRVIVVQDTPIPHTPDSIFPNNWVSFHDDGTVVLYPMFAENRRAERRGYLAADRVGGVQHPSEGRLYRF